MEKYLLYFEWGKITHQKRSLPADAVRQASPKSREPCIQQACKTYSTALPGIWILEFKTYECRNLSSFQ